MPNPSEYESEDEFMKACVPMVMDEGKEQDQAVAVCLSKWREGKSLVWQGAECKALGGGKVGGYLVRFSGADEPDLTGEFFDARTDYGPQTTTPVLYNHGYDPVLGKRSIGAGTLKADDVGIWIEAQLEQRDAYEKAIYRMAEQGKLGWSSGTAMHLVQYEGKRIASWPLGLDASLTPTPAEPRNSAMPLKAWLTTVPALEVEAEAVGDTAPTTTGGEVKAHEPGQDMGTESPTNTEVQTMDETEVQRIAKAAAEEAVKAYQAAQPVTNAGHAVVTGDEADRAAKGNPWKSFGEYLVAVVKAARGDMDQRLLPLRSRELDDEGGFEAERVSRDGRIQAGWLKSGATKATGMSEGNLPSAGFLVGPSGQGGLVERVYDVGSLLARIPTDNLSGDAISMTYKAEDETSRADGYRRGGILAYWAAEAGTVTSTKPKFREVELKLKKAMALVYATSEMLNDAAVLESYIMRNLPEELRFVVENAVINGNGAGQPMGILASPALISVTKESGQAADTIVYQNVIKQFARMWPRGLRNGIWLMANDCWPQLFQMTLAVGTGGQPVFVPPGGASVAPYGTLLGRPILVLEYMPKLGDAGDLLFFDPSQYQMIGKGGVESASSIHLKFDYDEQVFRFIMRVDGAPLWYSALTPYNASSTLSPFVAIAAR